jgi:hypothetical protein
MMYVEFNNEIVLSQIGSRLVHRGNSTIPIWAMKHIPSICGFSKISHAKNDLRMLLR